MTTYREHLIDRMTHIYGLEDPIVIQFAGMCERYTDNAWNDDNRPKCLVQDSQIQRISHIRDARSHRTEIMRPHYRPILCCQPLRLCMIADGIRSTDFKRNPGYPFIIIERGDNPDNAQSKGYDRYQSHILFS